MNLEQIKKDLDNGVVISRETWKNLVIYALDMQKTIDDSRKAQKAVVSTGNKGNTEHVSTSIHS